MKKAAVLFPGIGYHTDKPLLYYGGKMARKEGYEIITVPYTGFPKKLIGDKAMMQKAFDIGCAQAEEILREKDLPAFEDLIFFSKSIGTAIGASYAVSHGLSQVRHILFTPLEGTFEVFQGRGIAFHGSSDPWVTDEIVERGCEKAGLPLYLYKGANHSLETGDVRTDLSYLQDVCEKTGSYLFGKI